MKLAEALLDRAELQRKISDLQSRIQSNAIIQEGDSCTENPSSLFKELCDSYASLDNLNRQINVTNNTTPFDDKNNSMKICDALALRESLDKQISAHNSLSQSFNMRSNRMTKTEIKYVTTMNPLVIRSHVDDLKKQRKELDRKVQLLNWSVELLN